MSRNQLNSITEIEINNKNIQDLKGIEYFSSLVRLDCDGNQIKSLDLSKNTKLETLFCRSNKLTSLVLPKSLTTLYCSNNNLTSLNLTGYNNLNTLYCQLNNLNNLIVSGLPSLSVINCYNNRLNSLNLQGCTEMYQISCFGNQISGSNMDNLINSIDSKYNGFFIVHNNEDPNEGNKMTTTQVKAARNKGWTPLLGRVVGDGNGIDGGYISPNALYEGEVETLPKLTLTASPSGGQMAAGTTVTLTAKANGSTLYDCDIYYTLNGSTPSMGSTKYTSSGITISKNCTLKAIAYKDGYETSDVLTTNYTVKSSPEPETYYYVGSLNNWEIEDNTFTFTKQSDGKTWKLTMPCTEKIDGWSDDADQFKIGTASSLITGWEADVYGASEDNETALSGTMTKIYGPNFVVPFIDGMYSYTISIIPSTMHYEIVINKTTPTPTNRSVNISSAGYATFYDSQDNYSLPSGLTAQVVTGISSGKLTYRTLSGSIVPKGTAVMLKGSGDRTYTLTSTTESASYTGTNLLRGSDNATTTTGDGYHYKLCYGSAGSSLSGVFGWYWGASNGGAFRMDGHKAWLVLPKSGTRAEWLSVEDDVLGITNPLEQMYGDNDGGDCYDLMGRRVNQPTKKGLYIKNGKKIVNK